MNPEIEAAWLALKDGQLEKAVQLSSQLLNRGMASPAQVPLAQALTCQACFYSRRGAPADAVPILQNVLSIYPDDVYAQELMIAILREAVDAAKSRSGEARETSAGRGRLVLGLGTGRSGSTTLANILGAQSNCYFSHEYPPMLYWRDDPASPEFHIGRFRLLLELFPIAGDVSHWWLPYFRLMRTNFPDLRAVVLRRDREETIESFLRVKGDGKKGAINHWVRHDGRFWRKNSWDDCYPKYPVETLREAVACYWDAYYQQSQQLQREFPEQLRIFDLAALSDIDGQREVLGFCGIEDCQLVVGEHANRGHGKDGARLWPNFLKVLEHQRS